MSNVRTVRLLRAGEASDALPIVKGIPIPRVPDAGLTLRLVHTLQACESGDSFLWPENKKVYVIAKRHGFRITLRQCDGGFRV